MTLAPVEAGRSTKSAMADESEKKESHDEFIDPLAGMSAPPSEELPSDPSIHLLSEATPEMAPVENIEAASEEVGAMLDHALPVEAEPIATLEEMTITEEAHPTHVFQVKVSGLGNSDANQRFSALLKRLPHHPAFSVEEGHWQNRGVFRATRMNETAAYSLVREVYRAGLDFHLSIADFDAAPDELADLGPTLEPDTAKSIGAKAVEIPTSPEEILLSTTAVVAGYRSAKPKGVVTAHGSIPKILFREDEKNQRLSSQIEGMARKDSDSPTPRKLPRAEIDKVMAKLLERLQKEAYRRGANGVTGIQIQAFPESNSIEPEADQIRVIASGTAVLLVPENAP